MLLLPVVAQVYVWWLRVRGVLRRQRVSKQELEPPLVVALVVSAVLALWPHEKDGHARECVHGQAQHQQHVSPPLHTVLL